MSRESDYRKQIGRNAPNIKTQTLAYKVAEPDVKAADIAVVATETPVKFQMQPVRINPANVKPTYYFKHGGSMIQIDINGRRICQRCGGLCKVAGSPRFESADGNPKRIQKLKCEGCGSTDKVSFTLGAPYELLTPDAKDHPMANVLLTVASLADKMPSLPVEQQRHIVEQLQAAIGPLVTRD